MLDGGFCGSVTVVIVVAIMAEAVMVAVPVPTVVMMGEMMVLMRPWLGYCAGMGLPPALVGVDLRPGSCLFGFGRRPTFLLCDRA